MKTRVQKFFNSPSLTKQSFKNDCDINNVLSKYARTGVIEHLNRFQGNYSDFTSVQDYHTSMNQIIAAKSVFDTLPSKIRARFANDPGNFIEFVADPTNFDEMVSLGLVEPVVSKVDAPEAPVNPPEPVSAVSGGE